jgi:hypothetical protein
MEFSNPLTPGVINLWPTGQMQLTASLHMAFFKNLFSIQVSVAPEKLQLKLVELRYDSILYSSFKQEASITLYASLPVPQFSLVRTISTKFVKWLVAHRLFCI